MYLKVMLALLVTLEAAAAALLWRAARPEAGVGYYTDEEVAAGLNRRVRDVTLNNLWHGEVIERLSRETGLTIEVDGDALAVRDVYSERVSVRWRGTTVAEALQSIWAGRHGSEGVQVCPAGPGRIRVTTALPKLTGATVRVYDVRDLRAALVEPAPPGTSSFDGESVAEIVSRYAPVEGPDWFRVRGQGQRVSAEAGGTWVLEALPAEHRRVERVLHAFRTALAERADGAPAGGG
jgi:hypothetical protein